MLDKAQITYITEVLGVTEVIRPNGSEHELAPLIEGSTPEASWAVLVNGPLSAEARQLLGKILSAIKLKDAVIVSWPHSVSDSQGLSLLGKTIKTKRAIYFCKESGEGETTRHESFHVLKTLRLDLMTNESDPSTQIRKKQVWSDLQRFMKELDYH